MSDGHNYTFGSPAGGWPTLGPDGKRVRAERATERDGFDVLYGGGWHFIGADELARVGVRDADVETLAKYLARREAGLVKPALRKRCPDTLGRNKR